VRFVGVYTAVVMPPPPLLVLDCVVHLGLGVGEVYKPYGYANLGYDALVLPAVVPIKENTSLNRSHCTIYSD